MSASIEIIDYEYITYDECMVDCECTLDSDMEKIDKLETLALQQLVTDDITEFSKSINSLKRNIILDIDGTIVDSNDTTNIVIRPYVVDFLKFCNQNNIDVYIWTSAIDEHAIRIMKMIIEDGQKQNMFKCYSELLLSVKKILCRGTNWFTMINTAKKIKLLSNDISNIILIDNTEHYAYSQPDNVIVVPTYNHFKKDNTIARLLILCCELTNYPELSMVQFIRKYLKPNGCNAVLYLNT